MAEADAQSRKEKMNGGPDNFFDDDSRPVAVTLPADVADAGMDDERRLKLETIVRMLALLTRGRSRDVATIGKRVLLLDSLIRGRKQRDVAEDLGVTESAVSQNLKSLRDEMAGNIGD